MGKGKIFGLMAIAFLSLLLAPVSAGKTPSPGYKVRVAKASGNNPVMFIQNAGQWDERTLFQVWGGDRTIWLARDGSIWVTVLEPRPSPRPPEGGHHSPFSAAERLKGPEERGEARAVAVKLSFPGANPHPRIEPFGRLETSVNYFIGNDPAKWRTNVPVYGGVRYVDLYPGIDLELAGEGGRVVPRLVVRPGADLRVVRLRVEGAEEVKVEGDSLRLETALGEFTLPLLAVEGLNVKSAGVERAGVKTFEVLSPFAPAPMLPSALVQTAGISELLYATFLGGSGGDEGLSIAVDGSGNAYIVGNTESPNFPVTPGAHDIFYNGFGDVFVAKLNPLGGGLVYATFLGGSDWDMGYGIAVDGGGNAYVIGRTWSSDFPVTEGAYSMTYSGSGDAFVVKLNPSGSGLVYATFLGGSDADWGFDIALDRNGNVYVTGETRSSDFPATDGAYDTAYGGGTCGTAPYTYTCYDAFVAKLNTSGSGLLYATFLGGSSEDWGDGIAVDDSGNAYVTGGTSSSNFLVTEDTYSMTYNGSSDAFVIKLNPSGSDLVYATFLGGSGDDWGDDIAVDGNGNVYVTGRTSSSEFPTTPDTFDRDYNGGDDAFVAKLNPSGSGLVYATFLGGSNEDWGSGIAVDRSGNAYVTGWTRSSDFPVTTDAHDTSYNGRGDAFVAKLSPSGSNLLCATFLGGLYPDWGSDIVVDGDDNAYVTGMTWSSDFPTTEDAYDTTHNGGYYDAFVAKLAFLPDLSCSTKQASTVQVIPGQLITYTLTLSNCGSGDAHRVLVTDTLPISLTYQVGSLWASTGTYGEAGGVITWTGALSAGASATVRFSAEVSPPLSSTETVAILNVAQVDDGRHAPFGLRAVVFINPRQVFLPLILRNR